MSDDVLIRFVGHFDKSIPDFFEELWSLVALEVNKVENAYLALAGEQRQQYYITRGSTGIEAWSLDKTVGPTFVYTRTIQIEYEDNKCNSYQMVMSHTTKDGKYRIAMPLTPTLEGPFDGPEFE
jgi:hypothetical protein